MTMYVKHMYRQTLEHIFGSPTSPFEAKGFILTPSIFKFMTT